MEIPQGLESPIISKKEKFTYAEVVELTKNFEKVIGKGGFGVVYHGSLSNTEVAVKVLSESSVQGYNEFKAEVELLLRVRHVHLLSLVGYCDEEGHLALIYEYMASGTFKQHLSSWRFKGGYIPATLLDWAYRLKIALEAAQGLEYLHVGCEPPMVHRDVKSTNILMDNNFNSKLADFGLSRSFSVGAKTQGTPGYLDPEYKVTKCLNEKSDVYSFGIVLLEIVTNQAVIEKTWKKAHIVDKVKILISKGDLGKIVDPNFGGDYDSDTVWKVLELAMSCVSHSSSDRPNMSEVVNVLKECFISLDSGR